MNAKELVWPRLSSDDLDRATSTIDEATYRAAGDILDDVRSRGEVAVREQAVEWGDLSADAPLFIPREQLTRQLAALDADTRGLLQRTADRIRRFAAGQRAALSDFELPIPGGVAGQKWWPLKTAGCYAPGGRYPLPSSVLMTAVTARVAGVETVWVASPRPTVETIAAAAVADADGLLAVGGAQAIGAFAFGLDDCLPRADVIVGPGNRFVTAAKALVSRSTRIDMLAGPSELVVVAAADADAHLVAADLLAQAEHDPDAKPILITDDESLAAAVAGELARQLADLPTQDVATVALSGGGYIVVTDLEEAVDCCRQIAPEHLSLQGAEVEQAADRFGMGAALFIGAHAAEVLGDYGAGPNHVLPTGGSARSQSPLSVATFMRFQTYLRIEDPTIAAGLAEDAVSLGQMEGLYGHARSAELRCVRQ